jgi:hypothetical protein
MMPSVGDRPNHKSAQAKIGIGTIGPIGPITRTNHNNLEQREDDVGKFATIVLAFLAALIAFTSEALAYVSYPWCVMGSRRSFECYYTTREQCAEEGRGFGGTCIQNPFYHRPAEAPAGRTGRAVRAKPERAPRAQPEQTSQAGSPESPIIYRFNKYQGTDPDASIRLQLQRDGRNYGH